MAECNHNYKPRQDGIKEACIHCGAARMIDESRCNHDYQPRKDGIKEACTKCGAARVILKVDNMVNQNKAESPL